MTPIDSDTLYGTLNLLVLRALSEGALHGLAIARRIHQTSQEALDIGEGALYPALHRMEREGSIVGEWGISDTKRRARFYSLTKTGRERLREETRRWMSHAQAVRSVLSPEGVDPT